MDGAPPGNGLTIPDDRRPTTDDRRLPTDN